MLERQHPAEPLFCLFLLLAFQLSQVSETAQMEIYSKKKAKKINETKCPKLCRKNLQVRRISDVEASQLPLKVGVKREQSSGRRPDQTWMKWGSSMHLPAVWPVPAHTYSEIGQQTQERGEAFSFLPNTTHSSYLTATERKQPGLFITRGPAVISLECAAWLR